MVPKFRAYIKGLDEFDYNDVPHKGHFVYGNLIKGKPNDNVDAIVGDLIEINDEYVNVEFWKSIEKGSAEQATGVKDANGKEIYEGDIVRVSFDDESYVDEVVWWGKGGQDSCYPAFDLKKHSADYDQNAFSGIIAYGAETIEVIGNVHANPELLEAQHG